MGHGPATFHPGTVLAMPDGLSPTLQVLVLGAAGIGAQWLAWRVRIPSILPLLAVGLGVGPALGWVGPEPLLGELLPPLVSMAVAVVLFEGGLTLDLHELKGNGTPVLRLVSLGVLLTWALVYALARFVLGLSPPLALVLGALLTVTGPTVVSPLLNHVRPTGTVGPLLRWEGIVADVIGATLAVLTLGALASGAGAGAIALGLAKTLGTGVALGAVVALALVELIRRHAIPDRLEAQVTLALVLVTFVAGDALVHEAGLVAVTMMGFVLVNQRRAPIAPIVHFKELLATLLLGSLFVTLAASIDREDLASLDARTALFVAALVLVARPAAALLSLLGSRTTLAERGFVAGLAPRGVVAVSVAALFADRLEGIVPDAERLVPTVFAVVLGTVLVYGLGVGPSRTRPWPGPAAGRGGPRHRGHPVRPLPRGGPRAPRAPLRPAGSEPRPSIRGTAVGAAYRPRGRDRAPPAGSHSDGRAGSCHCADPQCRGEPARSPAVRGVLRTLRGLPPARRAR